MDRLPFSSNWQRCFLRLHFMKGNQCFNIEILFNSIYSLCYHSVPMDSFNSARRDLLRFGGLGFAAVAAPGAPAAYAATKSPASKPALGIFDIRTYGAVGDG